RPSTCLQSSQHLDYLRDQSSDSAIGPAVRIYHRASPEMDQRSWYFPGNRSRPADIREIRHFDHGISFAGELFDPGELFASQSTVFDPSTPVRQPKHICAWTSLGTPGDLGPLKIT